MNPWIFEAKQKKQGMRGIALMNAGIVKGISQCQLVLKR